MRLNLDWIDNPDVSSYAKLNELVFFTKDAKANGFDAASEVLAACKLFLEETEAGYRPSFVRLRPAMAITSAGVMLHRLMEYMDVAPDETSRVKQVIQLLDFLAFSCSDNSKHYVHLVAFEYADFLKKRESPGLNVFFDFIVKHAETAKTRSLLRAFFAPRIFVVGYEESCLYPEIFKAIERRSVAAEWFSAHMSKGMLFKVYEATGYPLLKDLMDKKGRGAALAVDLGI